MRSGGRSAREYHMFPHGCVLALFRRSGTKLSALLTKHCSLRTGVSIRSEREHMILPCYVCRMSGMRGVAVIWSYERVWCLGYVG